MPFSRAVGGRGDTFHQPFHFKLNFALTALLCGIVVKTKDFVMAKNCFDNGFGFYRSEISSKGNGYQFLAILYTSDNHRSQLTTFLPLP